MAHEPKRAGQEGSRAAADDLSTVEAIRAIAAQDARSNLDSESQLMLFLKSWWSRTYNRPLKDPILMSYTIEELLYEFYDRVERKLAEEERLKAEGDKIEDDKEKADLDWIEREEKKELDALKAEGSKEDPTKNPDNVKWMAEQLKNAKAIHGDTFGEDLSLDFDE